MLRFVKNFAIWSNGPVISFPRDFRFGGGECVTRRLS